MSLAWWCLAWVVYLVATGLWMAVFADQGFRVLRVNWRVWSLGMTWWIAVGVLVTWAAA